MYESINRFWNTPEFECSLNSLFGCNRWKEADPTSQSEQRKTFFYDLYKCQLKDAGAKYVLHFDLCEGDKLKYAIFFGTGSLQGCDKMKQAIWKIMPFGDFRFQGSQVNQLVLGEMPDLTPLQDILRNEFASKGWVRIEDITEFVQSDATDFHSGHLKVKTLKPMEKNGKIEVKSKSGTNRRKETFPDGTQLRFVTP